MLLVGSLRYAGSQFHWLVPKLIPPNTPLIGLYELPEGAGESKVTTVSDDADITVKDAAPLTPEREAVIVTRPPAATPVATPVLLITVATEELLEVHLAFDVMFCVELSE